MDPNAAVAAADLHQQHGLGKRIGLVVGKLVDDLQAVFTVFLRPVAGFAGFPRGTQAVNGRGDGGRIRVEGHRQHLFHTRQLALHEP